MRLNSMERQGNFVEASNPVPVNFANGLSKIPPEIKARIPHLVSSGIPLASHNMNPEKTGLAAILEWLRNFFGWSTKPLTKEEKIAKTESDIQELENRKPVLKTKINDLNEHLELLKTDSSIESNKIQSHLQRQLPRLNKIETILNTLIDLNKEKQKLHEQDLQENDDPSKFTTVETQQQFKRLEQQIIAATQQMDGLNDIVLLSSTTPEKTFETDQRIKQLKFDKKLVSEMRQIIVDRTGENAKDKEGEVVIKPVAEQEDYFAHMRDQISKLDSVLKNINQELKLHNEFKEELSQDLIGPINSHSTAGLIQDKIRLLHSHREEIDDEITEANEEARKGLDPDLYKFADIQEIKRRAIENLRPQYAEQRNTKHIVSKIKEADQSDPIDNRAIKKASEVNSVNTLSVMADELLDEMIAINPKGRQMLSWVNSLPNEMKANMIHRAMMRNILPFWVSKQIWEDISKPSYQQILQGVFHTAINKWFALNRHVAEHPELKPELELITASLANVSDCVPLALIEIELKLKKEGRDELGKGNQQLLIQHLKSRAII